MIYGKVNKPDCVDCTHWLVTFNYGDVTLPKDDHKQKQSFRTFGMTAAYFSIPFDTLIQKHRFNSSVMLFPS